MTDAIWLQGVGAHKSKRACDLVAGDVLVWNYGYTSTVVSIENIGKSQCILTSEENGKTYQRRMSRTRLLAVQGLGVYRNATKAMLAGK